MGKGQEVVLIIYLRINIIWDFLKEAFVYKTFFIAQIIFIIISTGKESYERSCDDIEGRWGEVVI